MDSKTRFTTFGIGALVGVLVLWGLNQKADPARERRRQVMASLSLPGMYYDHAVQGMPLFGHFVLAERRTPLPDGGVRRELVTGGRNRFDAEGRPLPNDLLLVTETYAPGVEPSESAKLSGISFAFADRADYALAEPGKLPFPPPAAFRFEPADDGSGKGVARLPSAEVRGEAAFALHDWVASLRGHPSVRSAALRPIDWQAEAERIRKESGE